jgi:hypothetical protein
MDLMAMDSFDVPQPDLAVVLPALLDTTRPLLEAWAQSLRDDANAYYQGRPRHLPVLARQDLLYATHHLLLLLDRYVAPLAPVAPAGSPLGSHAVRS